ncbi:Major royal jelly protein [Nesidiocoris tenuis]|uniref:Major royal jelly protein n=1 Tax=Nesidiocoris tenuis TaxID=355587 RepID=A0ABN7B802_9HEMI|nr:Major royal jelly protein [Nesidiocoris tenuis]
MPTTAVASFLVLATSLVAGSPAGAGLRREAICKNSLYPSGHHINWTCPEQKTLYIDKGLYTPKNILVSRVQIFGCRAYILTPRFLCGVPFTLGTLNMNGPCKAEPLLSPFPNWESHEASNANSKGNKNIINAVDVFIDRKKIMWILDVGITETLDKPKVIGHPKVLAICIQTSKIVAVVDLSKLCTPNSRFHELQVEVTEEDDTYIYVSDAGCKAIVVYDYSRDKGFKVQLPPEVADDCTSAKDILYLTLMNNTVIYFSFMNGKKMYKTETTNLRCPKTLSEYEEVGTKPGKLVILGSDRKTKMFFRTKGENQIFLWDTCQPFKSSSFVTVDSPPAGMFSTHVVNGFMQFAWALSSDFPDFANGNRGAVGPRAKLHPIYQLEPAEQCEEKPTTCPSCRPKSPNQTPCPCPCPSSCPCISEHDNGGLS